MQRPMRILLALTVAGPAACGAAPTTPPRVSPARLAALGIRAVPIGRAAAFTPAATPTAAVRRGARVAGLRCGPRGGRRSGVHLELFAGGRVVVVPAGIGIAPPRTRDGAYVRPRGCRYGVSTTEPTGVLELADGTQATLGDLFALWGRPLTPRRIAGFSGRVRAWVGGRLRTGDPRTIALTRHRQIVLAIGPPVPVHPTYTFREGL